MFGIPCRLPAASPQRRESPERWVAAIDLQKASLYPARRRSKMKRPQEWCFADAGACRSQATFQPEVSCAGAKLFLLTIAGSLEFKHLGVALAEFHQFTVASLFGDFAVLKHQNSIRHPDG
jgi:hypothetical protein